MSSRRGGKRRAWRCQSWCAGSSTCSRVPLLTWRERCAGMSASFRRSSLSLPMAASRIGVTAIPQRIPLIPHHVPRLPHQMRLLIPRRIPQRDASESARQQPRPLRRCPVCPCRSRPPQLSRDRSSHPAPTVPPAARGASCARQRHSPPPDRPAACLSAPRRAQPGMIRPVFTGRGGTDKPSLVSARFSGQRLPVTLRASWLRGVVTNSGGGYARREAVIHYGHEGSLQPRGPSACAVRG